jgi:ribokinase
MLENLGERERMIVGFGALNLDKIYRVDKIPGRDEEGFVRDVEMHPGGSAANTIVGLSRLGVKTGFIGKVGNDEEGKILLRDFEREGVGTSAIVKSEGRSGTAMIFVDDEGHRAILVDPGVNDTIVYEEIDLSALNEVKLIHMTSFICKNGVESFESQKRIAKEANAEISLDPGLIYVERGLRELKPIIERSAIFMPNRIEIESLMNLDFRDAAREVVSMGCRIVVVKLGEKGCYVTDGREEVEVRAYPSKPLDTTGAGDAFNAGFLYGYINGLSLEVCGKLGNWVASKNIQKVGARTGLPTEKELKDFFS